jgi:chromate transporter
VTVDLARQSIVDVPTVLLLVVAAVLLIRFRVNSTWLILGGAAVGLVLSAVQRTF